MNKKKFVILALLMICVIALSAGMLVACNDGGVDNADNNTSIEATEGLLIKNSDFKVVGSGDKYPLSITSWTGAKQYSINTFRDDVIAGAINLDAQKYSKNQSSWDDDGTLYSLLTQGGRFDNDDIKNVLMIYMPEESTNDDGKKVHGATAYGYTSSTFTLDKGAYYRFSVDVLTYNIGGGLQVSEESTRGARIYLTSNTYAEFDCIDTQGEWKTYEIYIEASKVSSTSLTIMLGLGKYSSTFTNGLTTGYAFFDNVVLEKLEDDAETAVDEAVEQYNDALAREIVDNSFVTTTTLTVPNGRFDFGTTTLSSSATPNNWSLVTGNRSADDPAPTSLGYNAVIDLAKFAENYDKYSSTYTIKSSADTATSYVPASSLADIVDRITNQRQGIVGNNVYMLSQQLMTAQGIKSSKQITFEKNKTYALSLDVYTYGIHGAGVSLVLSGSDGKDIVIKGISSNPSANLFIGSHVIDADDNGYSSTTQAGASTEGWTTYTFYIQGNQFKDYSYNMTVWLGTDGTNDNTAVTYKNHDSNASRTSYTADGTFSNGWVFIDELNLNEIDSLPATSATITNVDSNNTLDLTSVGSQFLGAIVDLTTTNLFGEGANYVLNTANGDSLSDLEVLGNGAPLGWTSSFDKTDSTSPIIDGIVAQGVVNIESAESFNGRGAYPGLPYDIQDKVAYSIYAQSPSSYNVQSASFAIEPNTFYRLSVWVKTVDIASKSGAYVYLVNADDDSTISSFTKLNTLDVDEYQNDWVSLTFVIRGAESDVTNVALKFSLGTGNRWATDTLTSGAMYVANMNMTRISYSNYSDTSSSTYVKAINLATTPSYTFTNGGFDNYDHDDDNLVEGLPLKEQTVAAMPESWTFSDNTLNPNTSSSQLVAGVVAFNTSDNLTFSASHQLTSVYPGVNFDSFYPSIDSAQDFGVYPGKSGQLLTIGSKDTTEYAAGFASSTVSLSSNTYYSLSVWVKTVGVDVASVFLTGESSVDSSSGATFTINGTNDWTLYTFYIKVGQTSASVNLNLWLGQNSKYVANALSSKGQLFVDNIIYNTIDEEDYEDAVEDASTKKLSFITDSFDAVSTTIDSRENLAKPTGWTGSVGTAQSSSNTKAGVIYVDGDYLETVDIDGVKYVKILGKDYKESDIEITAEELASAKEDSQYAGMSDDEITQALKDAKLLELKKNNWMPLNELSAHSGNRMLVINNVEKSEYVYTSSSMTLKENSYYEISVWVKTAKLSDNEEDGANVELYLGSANETDKPFIFKAIRNGEWTEYKFYVETLDEDVKSVTIKLSLGKYASEEVDGEKVVTGLVSGYAMFDDVTVKTVDEATFAAVTEDDTTLKRTVVDEDAGSGDEDDDEDNNKSSSFNLDALWWMIPTIVLGVIIIVVVVVLIVRKVRKQPAIKKRAQKAANPVASKTVDTKHSKYDENKE